MASASRAAAGSLDKLLAIQAEYGQPVTPAVREHLAGLQLHALEVAHPHEYRVRLVSDELEIGPHWQAGS
jgi:hypothetical protein